MALDLPLPKQVLGHPWLLSGEDKMSKSKGNVLYADELADKFGTDAVRYYLLSEIPFTQDGTITYESFFNRYNADLANTLGNLINRSIAMTNKYFGGTVRKTAVAGSEFDENLMDTARDTVARYTELMDIWHNAEAVETVMNFAKRCNKYIDETAPWAMAKNEDDRDKLETVLYNLLESIRLLTACLRPVIPETTDKILSQMQLEETALAADTLTFGTTASFTVGTPSPLFARIDVEKALADIAAEAQTAQEEDRPEGIAFLPAITIDEFAGVDLRVAKIVDCEPIKKAKKLLKLTLDDGSGTPRTVASGIALWYTPEELKGRTVIVVANLKPAVLCGVESNGMILAADDGDAARVIFVDGLTPGSKVR
jgi:methionyl-tRNA synthetase